MTPADRQLVEWYFSGPGRSTAGDLAVGFLIHRARGGTVTEKLERECKATLEQMRVERLRDLARAV